MKDLINQIINDGELSPEDKSNLIEKLIKASHGIDSVVEPGFYLHTDIKQESDDINIELWYRNVDESGMESHGPTNYDSYQIIDMMKNAYYSQKGKSK